MLKCWSNGHVQLLPSPPTKRYRTLITTVSLLHIVSNAILPLPIFSVKPIDETSHIRKNIVDDEEESCTSLPEEPSVCCGGCLPSTRPKEQVYNFIFMEEGFGFKTQTAKTMYISRKSITYTVLIHFIQVNNLNPTATERFDDLVQTADSTKICILNESVNLQTVALPESLKELFLAQFDRFLLLLVSFLVKISMICVCMFTLSNFE